ncbi:MAG TPA: LytTR family DNA-binding domain-containing protein [Oscillospiraceae bacterium]|nr:LytTR family DNA-binding domain-containing protein [Oscillospiraceae bacterium]HPF55264.1 LytTR family DNA-binding domain-containing protein [Clostridiales bacterium]HPK36010.1 LytTR family DNA-binding domain-containing protein [Oscillospiraceae bacterium]
MYIAICDDDANLIIDLKNKCKNAPCFSDTASPVKIQTYHSGEELITALNANPQLTYDIILLDIEFGPNTVNGIETTKILREMGIETPVIITTSYDSYLRQGYGLGIMRYITKPVAQEEIDEALTICLKKIALLDAKIVLRDGNRNTAVRYRDIVYFECRSHTVIVYAKTRQKYTCNTTISFIEEQMPKKYFYKIHKSFLVNFNYVSCIKDLNLTLDDGTVLLIAQRRRSKCMDFFREYVKENI